MTRVLAIVGLLALYVLVNTVVYVVSGVHYSHNGGALLHTVVLTLSGMFMHHVFGTWAENDQKETESELVSKPPVSETTS